ncbi:MAG: MerR family transcriptional regulator [Alphaproteobacteria bacterium]
MTIQLVKEEHSEPLPVVTLHKAEVKAPAAFRTISEVATEMAVPQHVLRFWESKFSQIRPMKRGGGRRYYRPEDVHLLKYIQNLLYNQGYTIRGVQKVLKETRGGVINRISEPKIQEADGKIGALGLPSPSKGTGISSQKRKELQGLLVELQSLRELLRQSGI